MSKVTLTLLKKHFKNYQVKYENTTTWFTGDIIYCYPVYYMQIEHGPLLRFYKIRSYYWAQFEDCKMRIVFLQSKLNSFNDLIPYYDWNNFNLLEPNYSYIFENYHEKINAKLNYINFKNHKFIKNKKKLILIFLISKRFKIPNEMTFYILSFIRLIEI